MASAYEKAKNLMDVPEEIIVHIFSFLSLNDILLRIALVCKYFDELTGAPGLWKRIDQNNIPVVTEKIVRRLLQKSKLIHYINLDNCHRFDELIAERITEQTQLTTLSLRRCLQSESLLEIIPRIKSLTCLNLEGNACVTDQRLDAIAKACTNLTSLNVGHCLNITAKSLRAVVENCSELKHLEMNWCHRVTDEFLATLPKNRITHLGMESCYSFTARGLECMGKFTHLVHLNASNTAMDDHLVSNLSHLKHLDLRNCKRFTHVGLPAIVQNNPRLEYLNLAGCDVNDDALEIISTGECRSTLEQIWLTWGDSTNQCGLDSILRSCSRLRNVVMYNVDLTSFAHWTTTHPTFDFYLKSIEGGFTLFVIRSGVASLIPVIRNGVSWKPLKR